MNPRKILVAEDELAIQKIIGMSLKFGGVQEVVIVGNGEECLNLARTASPDVILLDVMMPKLGGYETCRRLKTDPATQSIPVIFLTAKAQKGEEEIGRDTGALGYISKPFDPLTLLDQIQAILKVEVFQENS